MGYWVGLDIRKHGYSSVLFPIVMHCGYCRGDTPRVFKVFRQEMHEQKTFLSREQGKNWADSEPEAVWPSDKGTMP